MGFIIHFYIIFGTNLLTGGPAQIVVFCLFQCLEGKGYQTESKRNETFGNVIFGTNVIQRTWSGRQATNEEATRQGARLPPWARPPSSWPPRGSPDQLLSPIYIHIPRKHPGDSSCNYSGLRSGANCAIRGLEAQPRHGGRRFRGVGAAHRLSLM